MLKHVFIKFKRMLFGYSSEQYIADLRAKGAKIGEGTYFYDTKAIDTQYPNCIEIGRNVSVAARAIILAHDFSYSVLNETYGVMPQNTYPTVIEDNVFIGMGSIILMGTHVGKNCIIGAGSVVHGVIPDNTVWAGNPAKQICTLEDFKDKRESKFEEGAVNLAMQVKKTLGRKPNYEDMKMYIALFAPRTDEYRHYFEKQSSRFSSIADTLWNMEPKYKDLNEFLEKTTFSELKAGG